MRVVDNSCGGVCGHVLPSQKPDRGEGEDSMKIEDVQREAVQAHSSTLDVANAQWFPRTN
jgi:hypothetical protein